MDVLILFVHGYSVTSFNTYGGMPERLRLEAAARGLIADVRHIFLGRYVSFDDEVRLNDISRAFEVALRQQLAGASPGRFLCITHSTGGPVVRNWHRLFYRQQPERCPVTHLVMLAPPNHGSALAQLGKSRLGRIRSWLDGVEAGQQVLNWLELGSTEAWELNREWITDHSREAGKPGMRPFVLTGQDIDRKLYDHLNSYTGEVGSDGVVRVASANLNARYLRMVQEIPEKGPSSLRVEQIADCAAVPFRVLRQRSHSNETMGIMRSVKADLADKAGAETVDAIFACLMANTPQEYAALAAQFAAETREVQLQSRLETEDKVLRQKYYIHDRHAMIIFRVRDEEGHWLTHYDLVLTGDNDDPDLLPAGFFADRQCHSGRCSLSYYFNYDAMAGCPAVIGNNNEILRQPLPGMGRLGLQIRPRPDEGLVRYRPASLKASAEFFSMALQPNSTTLIEIVLRRQLSEELFRMEALEEGSGDKSFKDLRPGDRYF